MHLDLMNLVVCPGCRGTLTVDVERGREDDVESGMLTCVTCAASYPIVQSVPRFVPQENYSSSFGFQWNRFRRTQLDSTTGQPISSQRFFGQSGWSASDMSKG